MNPLKAFEYEDKLFVWNRMSDKVYLPKPDYQTGFTIEEMSGTIADQVRYYLDVHIDF